MAFRALVVLLTLLAASAARAQDPFEIQVYEYPTVPRGRYNLETHLNYVGRGTTVPEGGVATTNRRTHLTFELTRGITDHFELAGYLVTAKRSGHMPELVGWRVRPRVRAPESWRLPVGLSLSAEVGFPRRLYEENSVTLEIRPIIERQFGRLQLDVNPVVGRALRGPHAAAGWDFEPGVRLGYAATRRLDLSVEYYGSTGLVTDPLPGSEQVHQLYPGFDYLFRDTVVLNVGVGFGATNAGNRSVLKMRLGVLFGGTAD